MVLMSGNNGFESLQSLRRENTSSRNNTPTPKILLIFDIDGTLSNSGSFSPCLSRATEELLGITITEEDQSERVNSGIPFRNWLRCVSEKKGISESEIENITNKVLSKSIKYFEEKMFASPTMPIDGAVEFLKEVSKDERFAIGIVTNNLEEVAIIKLKSAGLLPFFENAGLIESCEGIHEKSRLIEHVMEVAQEKFAAKFDREKIFYFGDQVSDVKAGKMAGVKTIGVATGRSTLSALVDAGADLALAKFSNATTIIDFIERNALSQKPIRIRSNH